MNRAYSSKHGASIAQWCKFKLQLQKHPIFTLTSSLESVALVPQAYAKVGCSIQPGGILFARFVMYIHRRWCCVSMKVWNFDFGGIRAGDSTLTRTPRFLSFLQPSIRSNIIGDYAQAFVGRCGACCGAFIETFIFFSVCPNAVM